ncbi:MAG: cytidylyltransferase domain-containing protein [Anaerolineales bacterium]
MTTHSLVALVPMRHHSERVPGKNYRELHGRPLYAYILDTLHQVREVELIVVDTDSPILREGIHSEYPDVHFVERPEHLTEGTTPMNEVLLHDVSQVKSNVYLQTHSTNPLLRPDTIQDALQVFHDSFPVKDSLFGVTKLQSRLWDGEGNPINHDLAVLQRTQDLEPVYEENSCIYIFERQTFLDRRNRIGDSPYLYEIDPREAVDMDNEADFRLAESIMQSRS